MKSAITLASIVLGLAVAACGSDKTQGSEDNRHESGVDVGYSDADNSKVDSGCRYNCGRADGGSDAGRRDASGSGDIGSPDVPVTPIDAGDGGEAIDGPRDRPDVGSADASGSPDADGSSEASSPDASTQTNTAPNVVLIYEQSHPLTGQEYTSRNVRRQRDTTFLARGSDSENGTGLEYKCNFGDGTSRDWSTDPRCIHGFDTNGNYSLVVRVRDPQGLEGSVTATLNVVANIPPVARLADCTETDAEGRCVYRLRVGERHTWNTLPSYDEDGSVVSVKFWLVASDPEPSWEPGPSGRFTSGYSPAGEYIAAIEVTDNEGAVNRIEFVNLVEN